MKYPVLILVLLAFPFLPAQSKRPDAHIKLCLQAERQIIDGFGVAQAAWAAELYQHEKRTEVMHRLFSNDGLRLSILRGEVFPVSATDTIDDFAKRAGQVWISRYARNNYKVDKLIFSTWSPPAYMKSNGNVSHGFLKPEYYQAFADYLTAFCKAYEEAGLKVYAISPSNEPGYEAPWNSCKWTPEEMGRFLTEYLAPAFRKNCPDVQIVYGENPTWSTPKHPMLQFIASEKFVNDILEQYPEVDGYPFIASGHGYDIPVSQYFKDAEDIATPAVPYTKAIERNQKVWITEISSVDALDASMENGLKWAAIVHNYLTKANVNAFVWWAGAIPTTNNESLIVLDKNGKDYSLTKRYETFGNYSRYIPVGSRRIEVASSGLPEEVLISAFKKEKEYSAVMVNPTMRRITCRISADASKAKGELKVYTTTRNQCWQESSVAPEGDTYTVILEPQSVTSLTGRTD